MRLALAQLNPLVGDLEGNAARILARCQEAAAAGADLVLTPELSLWGYPPRDLLLRPALLEAQRRSLEGLAAALPAGLALLVGVAEPLLGEGQPALHNAVALVAGGRWRVVARKRLLPSYDVFDERRYFRPGSEAAVLDIGGGGRRWRLGLTICEDLWVEETPLGQPLGGCDPIADLQGQAIDLLVNLSASPFGQGKAALRRCLAGRAAGRLGVPAVYVNQVGGNDELVFDGGGFVVDAGGAVLLQQPWAMEDLALWEMPQPPAAGFKPLAATGHGDLQTLAPAGGPVPQQTPDGPSAPVAQPLAASLQPPAPQELLLRALVLGVADYARKCGFRGALLGLSGGIDSALVAVIACAALGAERVRAMRMPSPWSSAGSLSDAEALAQRLGMVCDTVPIAPLMAAFDTALSPALGEAPRDVTAENLQSRLRGTLLMAVANQQGQLLLSTGNKSELAVGYCTLYGDMNGGLAVIGDLYKSTVFQLCDWLDAPESAACRAALGLPAEGELIGEAIRRKPPSAELRPDQRDSDSLPDYAVLDPILRRLIEEMASPEDLVAAGHDPALVERIWTLLRRAEFKRRQAAPALKVSRRSFGSGWRMPIAAG
jgi:NAD+ synthase (glutamine-hydrolysing)